MENTAQQPLQLVALLVEDSALDADVLIRFLRYHDIEIQYERVDTMPQLLNAMTKRWDIIFCDYNIHTGFTGMDALKAIREYEDKNGFPADKPAVRTPVIMISSILNENAIVTAMNAGASDYIIKGYLERLVPLLRREMGYVRTIEQYFEAWQRAERKKE